MLEANELVRIAAPETVLAVAVAVFVAVTVALVASAAWILWSWDR